MGNNSAQAKDLMHRARTRLLSQHPFYGHLCCRLRLREDSEQPTMATDMVHLFYNPDFVLSQTKTQLVAALAHETHHVYMKHPLRMEEVVQCRDYHKSAESFGPHDCYLQIAMVAADYAINPTLKDGGFDLMPEAVYPEKQYWNDSFEGHYKRMAKSAKKVKCQLPAAGGCSGVKPYRNKDGKAPSPAERAVIDADIQRAIFNAANFAKAAGKLPADIERMLADMRAPIISWKDVLRRFMQSSTKNDYRMMPPNRRYIHQGLYLPSLRSEAVERVLLILDGSGSTYGVFPQFVSEFASIVLDVRPETLDVMVWDTRCTWEQQFDGYSDESVQSIREMQAKMGAGGGTVFTECFNYYEQQHGARPNIGIVLTDMELYGGFPEDPGYPVLWVATTDIVGPYGETVKIEAE